MPSSKENESSKISVADFVEKSFAKLDIEVLAGKKGLHKKQIVSGRIQKLGLALAGFTHYIHEGRIQIIGQSEISYLSQLESAKRIEAINNLDLEKICCVLITKKLVPPEELLSIADERNLPILRTAQVSSNAISHISSFLLETLAPQITLHGVLIGMYELGVLLLGESGIGKSECALDLIARGHRLIADDAVLIKKLGENLEGFSPELTRGHLEIRGLGIINVRDLFGVSAIANCKKIELCIEFQKWKEVVKVERLGLDRQEEEIFGVKITKFILPVSAGRNLSTLVETAVRVHLLKVAGFDAAQKLVAKHSTIVSGQ
ncbi:HPr(Ser) kinase/phosphatase [soil metagenome]|jgi:HPr kinase/phosphorylase|nr:HPr(Ser) kinase/phosphatase [Acidobacteriota bacterium]